MLFKKSFPRMHPLAKSWYYWAMSGLLIAQVVLSVNYHVLICNMPIANTLLLLIIMAHHGYVLGDQVRPLFHRICGCVAYVAVLFVNTSHALELLSETNGGHSHGSSDDDFHPADENGTVHYGEFQFVPFPYFVVSIFDVILKLTVLILGHIPAMGLACPLRVILHTLSPVVVIGMYAAGVFVPASVGDTWIWKHVDPITAFIMSIFFFFLIYPAFKEMMPYIFADSPDKFNEELFRNEISEKFPDVTCPHIHAYRLWPGNLFEALIHINIRVDKQDPNWSSKAAVRYEKVSQNIATTLTKAGAQKVVTEPRFVDANELSAPWMGCVEESCFKSDRGCCAGEALPPTK